jgi:hypothetical protein
MAAVDLEAEVIVEGTIVAVQYDVRRTVTLNAPVELPFTAWSLDVTDAIRGEPGNQIDLTYVGGSLDGVNWMTLASAPHFEIGERVVVYGVSDGHGTYRMIDWEVGILRQRVAGTGAVVTLAGSGAPIASLSCDLLPTYVSVAVPEPVADDGAVESDADPLDLALSWSDALAAVTTCASEAGVP